MKRIWLGLAVGAFGASACGGTSAVASEAVRVERIRLLAAKTGTDDTVAGAAGALPGGSVVHVYGDAALQQLVASGEAAGNGSFGPLSIGDNVYGQIWIEATKGGERVLLVALENDVTGPLARIVSGPPESTSEQQARFELACDDEGGCTFECGLDGGIWHGCQPSLTADDLLDGGHSFRARAIDALGNVGPTVQRNWQVAIPAPDVRLVETPPDPSNSSQGRFRFSSTTPGATFECSEGHNRWSSCRSPYTSSSLDGTAEFLVRAVLHESRSEPVRYTWRVDTHGPEIQLGLIDRHLPEQDITFTCQDDPCTAFCALDDEEYAPCTSPWHVSGMAEGTHVIWIKAIDGVGNEGIARYQFELDLTPMSVVFLSTPPAATRDRDHVIQFQCDTPGLLCYVACSLDGTPLQPCESPVVLTGLAEGPHLFAAQATDWVGNVGPIATASFVVDDTAPELVFDATPDGISSDREPTFEFSCVGEPCSFECAVDLTDPVPCTSPWTVAVEPGPRSITVRATDRVELMAEQTFEWTVE